MVEELGINCFLFAILISFIFSAQLSQTPFLSLLLLLTFIACRYILNPDQLILLLDSLGDDLGSSDHNYTIISLVLDKSTLESY